VLTKCYFGDQIQKKNNGIDGKCSEYRGEGRCIESFDGEIRVKETF
jgi:hypothetical protein